MIMTTTTKNRLFALALAVTLFLGAPSLSTGTRAFAQEAGEGGPPSQEEIIKKVQEIEKLMRGAEEALARSTHSRRARADSEKTAAEIEKLINEQAQAQSGKSADQLRQEAAAGSEEARKQIEQMTKDATAKIQKLMESAGGSAGGAADGVRKLLEKTKSQGEQAAAGIEWILRQAGSSGRSGGQGKHQPRPEDSEPQGKKPGQDDPEGEKPDDPKEDEDDPNGDRPESDVEPPKSPEFEKWYAALPPQVRKAYESEDWNAIPVQWRGMLRAWTKLFNDLEKDRR